MTARCANCNRVVNMLVNSHIVPEFMYDGVYDNKNRAYCTDFKSSKWELVQKGIRNKFLCSQCEGEFGVYDTYASGVFKLVGPTISNVTIERISGDNHTHQSIEIWRGLDYKKTQNFVFSVIKRKFLSGVGSSNTLNPDEYQEMMNIYSDIVLEDDSSFPIVIVKWMKGGIWDAGVTVPTRKKYADGNETVFFKGGGFGFEVYLGTRGLSDNEKQWIEIAKLSKAGTILIMTMDYNKVSETENNMSMLGYPKYIYTNNGQK